MCYLCPAHLDVDTDGIDLRVTRIAETEVAPADVAPNQHTLAQFQRGERFLMALQATVYVHNRPVVTEALHGVMECDIPGEVACAFEHTDAMECLVRVTMEQYREWEARQPSLPVMGQSEPSRE